MGHPQLWRILGCATATDIHFPLATTMARATPHKTHPTTL
jgi:hypothetical protein